MKVDRQTTMLIEVREKIIYLIQQLMELKNLIIYF